MEPDPTIAISCDELVEYEEDAAPFAQAKPEFLNGPPLAATPESASANSPSPPSAAKTENAPQ
jgi:hypothetical protein